MNTVNTNEFFTINCSGESFEIKPGPPDHVKNLVNNVSQSPTDEELDTFLGYFFPLPIGLDLHEVAREDLPLGGNKLQTKKVGKRGHEEKTGTRRSNNIKSKRTSKQKEEDVCRYRCVPSSPRKDEHCGMQKNAARKIALNIGLQIVAKLGGQLVAL